MLFQKRFHQGLRDGSIDRSYRLWKSAKVRIGNLYRFAIDGAVQVTALDKRKVGEITDRQARRSGFTDRDGLVAYLGRGSAQPLSNSAEVFEVRLRFAVPEEPPTEVTLEPEELAALCDRLDATDRRSRSGPWAWATLELIERHPHRRAGDLAPLLGAETKAFKQRVRRLKGLGLTRSFEVGYELTALGQAVLRRRTHG